MLVHQSDNSVSNVFHTVHFIDYHVGIHFHRGYEMLHLLEGQIELTVNGRVELLQAGDFALILSNQPHRLRAVGSSHLWICGFSTDFLPEFHKKVNNRSGSTSVFRCNDSVYDYLKTYILPYEDHEGNILDPFQLKGSLYLLCSDYLRTTTLEKRDHSQYKLMNTISDYVAENYHRKLGMREIADDLGYEYSYFSKLFRSVFGIPFPEFLNSYRCSAAVEMIRDTDESIASISVKSGFQSIRTFNSVFQKQMGMTPSQYMKQLKTHNQ